MIVWTVPKKIVLKSKTATVGDRTRLSCRTTLPRPVDWHYRQSEQEESYVICAAGNIVNGYNDRFELEKSVQGDFSLIISSVKREDAGVYICIEDVGQGVEHRWTLTVRGK